MLITRPLPSRLLVAVGGNAIHPGGIAGTPDEQRAIVAETAGALLPLMQLDTELIVTHGNGPVVGKILMRQAVARDRVVPMPLDICVAHSQGGIAYLLMQAFENALRAADSARQVVCLLTQVEVDAQDPAFARPTKPIGYFYTADEADALQRELGWPMREDAGRGWRLAVASPEPRRILDLSLVDALAKSGAIVIAGGGGGIPVVCDATHARRGVEAVVDKDLTSALMARSLGIDVMMILTGVSRVAIHFGTPQATALDRLSLSDARRYLADGHFPTGSMGPKIQAAIRFLETGGTRAVIAHLLEALPALRGEAGTQIVADW